MAHRSFTFDERRERLDAAQLELARAVEQIASGEQWQAFLDFASHLPSYSTRNCMWLMAQASGTRLGGDGLRGWVPHLAVAGSPRPQEREGATRARTLPVQVDRQGYRRAVGGGPESSRSSQSSPASRPTGAESVPERIRPELLTGEGPAGAWDALAALVEAQGYTIARAPLAPANGTTSFVSHLVTVADRLDEAATVKTLVHELAHVLMHVNVDYHANRGRCEWRPSASPTWCAVSSDSTPTPTASPM